MSDSAHIVLIDGHTEDREYYADRLKTSSSRYAVTEAATGRFGIALCQRQLPDCVVLELDLPDISGFEVLIKLVSRPLKPEVGVIILTRLCMPLLLDAALKNGAQAVINKSMGSGDLLERNVLRAIVATQRDRKKGRR